MLITTSTNQIYKCEENAKRRITQFVWETYKLTVAKQNTFGTQFSKKCLYNIESILILSCHTKTIGSGKSNFYFGFGKALFSVPLANHLLNSIKF